jgi:hypothetical protein
LSLRPQPSHHADREGRSLPPAHSRRPPTLCRSFSAVARLSRRGVVLLFCAISHCVGD